MTRKMIALCAILGAMSFAFATGARGDGASEDQISDLQKRVSALEAQMRALVQQKVQPANTDVSGAQDIARSSAGLQLVKWDYQPHKGDVEDFYRISYTLANGYDKSVKLIDASIQFDDLLGNNVYGIIVEKDVAILPGKEVSLKGDFRRNLFMPEQQRMSAMAKSDIVTRLVVRNVVFADNSILKLSP